MFNLDPRFISKVLASAITILVSVKAVVDNFIDDKHED